MTQSMMIDKEKPIICSDPGDEQPDEHIVKPN
jgi:hypothetical protein